MTIAGSAGIKKAVIDFALQDPRSPKISIVDVDKQPTLNPMMEMGSQYEDTFKRNKKKLENNLFTIHPVLSEMTNIWFKYFK